MTDRADLVQRLRIRQGMGRSAACALWQEGLAVERSAADALEAAEQREQALKKLAERLTQATHRWLLNDSDTAYYDEKEIRDAAVAFVHAFGN